MSGPYDWIQDLFEPVGPIAVRRMFGGAGLYRDGVMFGLVSGNEIFLRCDDETASAFREAGCRPFSYEKKGKPVALPYWSIPAEAVDDVEYLKHWAEMAYAAALRTRQPARRARS